MNLLTNSYEIKLRRIEIFMKAAGIFGERCEQCANSVPTDPPARDSTHQGAHEDPQETHAQKKNTTTLCVFSGSMPERAPSARSVHRRDMGQANFTLDAI
ncbi:hypothetical protein HI914_02910 [Erysiphe necator]|nr:hypothetical protein HI914_02910 [Erysiphe necator]